MVRGPVGLPANSGNFREITGNSGDKSFFGGAARPGCPPYDSNSCAAKPGRLTRIIQQKNSTRLPSGSRM